MRGYTRNTVYTKIRDSVLSVSPKAYVSSVYVPTPSKFPTVFAKQANKTRSVKNVTFTNDDEQWRDTIEVQVFSNKASGAATEAYLIMEEVETILKKLGYILDICQPIENIDTTIYRLVGRWHRTTGKGDQIPEN